MEKYTTTLATCATLLQNILQDAFALPVVLFTPPYENIRRIDQGLRAMVWHNFYEEKPKISFASPTDACRILVIKSNLGFYNVLIPINPGEKPDFFSIGPFRDEDLSPNYFSQILMESKVNPADLQAMKHIYERMPNVHPDTVVNVAKHTLSVYFPEFQNVTPELLKFSEEKRTIDIDHDLVDTYSIEQAEHYHRALFSFLDALKSGDTTITQKALHSFLKEISANDHVQMRKYKLALQMINDYCHLALLNTNIHPFYIVKQTFSLRNKIETMTSMTQLEKMPNEICHKYCLLIKNYDNQDYSRLTKRVIDYIHLHLDEDLSLSFLAEHFRKNPSSLSNMFSKDTGISLTKYIQKIRIQEAIRLFNTTELSVSEVAMTIGYQDFSYFSKVFSKNTGCSPREYKQHLS